MIELIQFFSVIGRVMMECWPVAVGATGLGLFIFGTTWPTRVNNVTTVDASHINSLQTYKVDCDGETPFDNTGCHILDTNASHDLIIKPGSNLTADRTLTVTTGDADRTLMLSANLTVSAAVTLDQDVSSNGSPTFLGGVYFESFDAPGYICHIDNDDSTGNSTLDLNLQGGARTLTLSGNPTLADWFDQSVKTTDGPTFDHLHITNAVSAGSLASTAGVSTGAGNSFTSKNAFLLADDTVYSVTPTSSYGFLLALVGRTDGESAVISCRTTATSNYSTGLALGADVVVGTGALTDGAGDGTDAKVNVNTHTDGKLYIKNRMGGNRYFSYSLIGGQGV